MEDNHYSRETNENETLISMVFQKLFISRGPELLEMVIVVCWCSPVFSGPRKTAQSSGGKSAMQPELIELVGKAEL